MTYLLVHGGGSTGRTWDRLVPHLDRPAHAVDLPGRAGVPGDLTAVTVDDEVAHTAAVARSLDGPVVLVAHSSGGLVVPGVVATLAGSASPVTRVVLVAALVPPEGGTALDCLKPAHRDGLLMAVEMGPVLLPGAPEDPEPFRTAYGGDPLSDDQLAFVVDPARCVPDGVHHYFQPVHWSLVGAGVPVTYVLTLRDRPVRTAAQREMSARLPPSTTTIVELDTGHLPMVTHPADLAAIVTSG